MIPLLFGNIGATEALVILLVVLLLFGGKENTGTHAWYRQKGVAGFRKGIKEIENEIKTTTAPDSEKDNNA